MSHLESMSISSTMTCSPFCASVASVSMAVSRALGLSEVSLGLSEVLLRLSAVLLGLSVVSLGLTAMSLGLTAMSKV